MDADLSLTGNGGATGNSQGTSDKQMVMVKLDCGLLEELGISEENVGKLLSELLRGYIRGTRTQEQTASQRTCDASRNDEVSAQYARDFPSLTTRQEKQKLEIPLFARGSDEPDSMKFSLLGEHSRAEDRQAVAGKRRCVSLLASTTAEKTNAEKQHEDQLPTQTIVLKPICRENVKDFTTRNIQKAVKEAGIASPNDYKIQIQPKTNTIALTTRNGLITDKLLQITEVKKGDNSYALRPYKAMGNNNIRGVIYLHGDNNDETPETLKQDMDCRTNKIVYARLMGKNSNTVVITFEGTTLPRKVIFCREVYDVKPYLTRPIVCFHCHGLGHMTDVCPNRERRCGKCGHAHEDMEECEREPQCRNCGGPHVALSNECPKRQIPKNKTNQRQRSQQGRASYAAAAKLVPTPPINQTDITGSLQEVFRFNANHMKNSAIKGDHEETIPKWIPSDWIRRTTKGMTEQPEKQEDLESRATKLETKVAKMSTEMTMGFEAVFRAIADLKKDIATLKHGK